jgi:hypothetical protein
MGLVIGMTGVKVPRAEEKLKQVIKKRLAEPAAYERGVKFLI